MIGAGTRVAALGALALLAAACMSPGDFRCSEHAQCVIANLPGYCEANGHCSVGDPKCPASQRRYAHRAGDDSDACVPRSCEDNAITLLTTGGGHACLARADGSLWCWGRNDHGQIGDKSRTPRALPVRVPGISHPQAIAAGDTHTCAAESAESGGRVLCWGADDGGQLGDSSDMDQGLPREVPGISNVTALAAGKDFTCALGQDGGVRCWGDDSVGQLGDGGSPEPARPPALVAALTTNVVSLSASWQHVCVIDAAMKLSCWGANDSGQIGDGTTTGPRLPTTPLAPLPAQVTAVAAGHDHTCGLAGGDLYCWGENSQGQVVNGVPSMAKSTPVGLDLRDPAAVVAGGQFTCIKGGGDAQSGSPITCWGANDSEQIGGGTPIKNATEVAAGAAFGCAIASDGALFCWGDNHYGELAVGGDTVRPTAAPVPGLTHVGALAAGGAHNCATADDADGAPALFCWGANGSSQLGNLSSTDAPAPTRISALQPIGIAAGRAHTCAFAADRELRCWGWGAAGQLGQPPGMDMVITSPTITDLGGPAAGDGLYLVTAGAAHTCVGATISASVLCFGLNSDGQLGAQNSPGGPDAVPSLLSREKPKALAAGDAHTCALADGVVSCWGAGGEGQLGDGSIDGRAMPVVVALGNDLSTADAVVAGAAHTCALGEGKIVCWGRNAEGQAGWPIQMPLVSPTLVNGISQARAVAAGGRHTCAIEGDATVRCWGANESGQLGNGNLDVASSNKPVTVVGLTNADAIVTGGAHSCARRTDGSVWCWGSNTSGQLGDGVTLTSQRALLARAACE